MREYTVKVAAPISVTPISVTIERRVYTNQSGEPVFIADPVREFLFKPADRADLENFVTIEPPAVPHRVVYAQHQARERRTQWLREQSRPWRRFVRWQASARSSVRWAIGSVFVRFGEWVRG